MILMKIRTYQELCRFQTFKERFEYLKLNGQVGKETFGFDRYLNQIFYQKNPEWKRLRNEVIVRDSGCDLGIEGRDIYGIIMVHHMNPIAKEDILNQSEILLNPDYLITVSKNTHDAIHYGSSEILIKDPVIRTPNDTCPWKRF